VATDLQAVGVALLLAPAEPDLRPPKAEKGIPGVRCTEPDLGGRLVRVEAIGYPSPTLAEKALARARAVLDDARMITTPQVTTITHPAITVRRRDS
jgi:hypothetical protein